MPSATDAVTRAGFGPANRRSPWPSPSGLSGRRTRRWSPCPRPLSAGRTSVHWSGGRPVSTRPVSTRPVRSGCPDGHASGVRGLCVRAVPPGWILESVRRGSSRLGASSATCRWVASGLVFAAESGPGGEGWSCVGSAWLARGSAADLGRRSACAQAAAPCSPPGRPGSESSARVPSVG